MLQRPQRIALGPAREENINRWLRSFSTATATTCTRSVSPSYYKENRSAPHWNVTTVVPFTSYRNMLKRRELVNATPTTIVWDGTEYLQGRS